MKTIKSLWHDPAVRFSATFISLFLFFDLTCLALYGLSLPGNHYSQLVANYLNIVHGMRWLLLHASRFFLVLMGHPTVFNESQLLVAGHARLILNYNCLGFGVMSFFSAFVIAFPKPLSQKLVFLIGGLFAIQLLNVTRLILLALYWHKTASYFTDPHTIFDIVVYLVVITGIYCWIRSTSKKNNAAN